MNYSKHYQMLCYRAKNRILNYYSETHHIVPKCLGGNDDPSNLIKLTPEEHYIAHQLLVKMHPGNIGLIFASHAMTLSNGKHIRNNKKYSWLRKHMSIAMSFKMRENNPMKPGMTNSGSKKKGDIPWNLGKKFGPVKKSPCPKCGLIVAPNMMARYHGVLCKI